MASWSLGSSLLFFPYEVLSKFSPNMWLNFPDILLGLYIFPLGCTSHVTMIPKLLIMILFSWLNWDTNNNTRSGLRNGVRENVLRPKSEIGFLIWLVLKLLVTNLTSWYENSCETTEFSSVGLLLCKLVCFVLFNQLLIMVSMVIIMMMMVTSAEGISGISILLKKKIVTCMLDGHQWDIESLTNTWSTPG